MRFPLYFLLLMVPTAGCGILRSIIGGIIPGLGIDHEAIESLRGVKNKTSSFSKTVFPYSYLYDIPFGEGIQRTSRNLLSVSEVNPEKAVTNPEHPRYAQIESDYETNIYMPIKGFLEKIDILQQGEPTRNEIREFTKECDGVTRISEAIQNFKGWHCSDSSFSHKTATIIFRYIDHFKFENYFLSEEEQSVYNARFAVLYFYLNERPNITIFDLGYFINPRQVILYKNKIKPLEELIEYLEISGKTVEMSDCIPLTSYLLHHFNSTAFLEEKATIVHHMTALKEITRMCSDLIQNENRQYASQLTSTVEEHTFYLNSIVSQWFIAVMNSTWDETETDLMRGFMKEAAEGRPVPPSEDEYKRIATHVHQKMKSFGDPRFWRQYVCHADPKDPRSWNFEHHCKWNSCSHAVNVDAQCMVFRIPKGQTPIDQRLKKLTNFIGNITETVYFAMRTRFWLYPRLPEVVWKIEVYYGVEWEQFKHHSSLVAMKESRFRRGCKVLYGISADAELGPTAFQTVTYHDDGHMNVDCFDWVFLLGI